MKKKKVSYTPIEIGQLKEIIKLNPNVRDRNKVLLQWCEVHKRSMKGVECKVRELVALTPKNPNEVKLPEPVKVYKTSDIPLHNTLILPIKTLRIENNNIIITW